MSEVSQRHVLPYVASESSRTSYQSTRRRVQNDCNLKICATVLFLPAAIKKKIIYETKG